MVHLTWVNDLPSLCRMVWCRTIVIEQHGKTGKIHLPPIPSELRTDRSMKAMVLPNAPTNVHKYKFTWFNTHVRHCVHYNSVSKLNCHRVFVVSTADVRCVRPCSSL